MKVPPSIFKTKRTNTKPQKQMKYNSHRVLKVRGQLLSYFTILIYNRDIMNQLFKKDF